MDVEQIREYCLKKKDATESLPFDDETLVFKVGGKMFCLLSLRPPYTINLKCEPEYAVELREKYEAITPGYHMNKKHWNTIDLNSNLTDWLICEWIDHSYELVRKGLPKKQKRK